jgi:hemerythrin-like domain-containing protein
VCLSLFCVVRIFSAYETVKEKASDAYEVVKEKASDAINAVKSHFNEEETSKDTTSKGTTTRK